MTFVGGGIRCPPLFVFSDGLTFSLLRDTINAWGEMVPPGEMVEIGGIEMTKEVMIAKIIDLKELIRMKEELEATIESTKDEIKAGMGGEDVVVVGGFKVSNKEVTSTRLDTKALKKGLGEAVLAPYMVTSVTRRFLVS